MNEITVVNLTNHYIMVYPYEYTDIEIPVKKQDEEKLLSRCIKLEEHGQARAQVSRDSDTAKVTIKGSKGSRKITLSYTHIGASTGLREPKENTIYIVSQLLYNAFYHLRKDIYTIDEPIRTVSGNIIACRSFSRCCYDMDNKQLDFIDKLLKKLFSKSVAGSDADELSKAIILLNEYRKK